MPSGVVITAKVLDSHAKSKSMSMTSFAHDKSGGQSGKTKARSWALDPNGSKSMADSADVAPLPVAKGIGRSSGKAR